MRKIATREEIRWHNQSWLRMAKWKSRPREVIYETETCFMPTRGPDAAGGGWDLVSHNSGA
jgi:hypothetical protein